MATDWGRSRWPTLAHRLRHSPKTIRPIECIRWTIKVGVMISVIRKLKNSNRLNVNPSPFLRLHPRPPHLLFQSDGSQPRRTWNSDLATRVLGHAGIPAKEPRSGGLARVNLAIHGGQPSVEQIPQNVLPILADPLQPDLLGQVSASLDQRFDRRTSAAHQAATIVRLTKN